MNANNMREIAGKVRIRVCGILIIENKILLVKHNLENDRKFWAPPGGGLEFGESVKSCLQREFNEETGISIQVEDFCAINEFIDPPLHAIELFFKAGYKSGKLVKGNDPEFDLKDQIIDEVAFLGIEAIRKLKTENIHSIFHKMTRLEQLYEPNFLFRE